MYKKGEITIDKVYGDSRNNYKTYTGRMIQLPHSCDEWIIGGKEEAEHMIEDLKEAIITLGQEESKD